MTQSGRFIIKIISALIILINAAEPLIGQNLYDIDHSRKYADFLFQSQQYRLAAMEYERLDFMDSESKEFRENLIISYRKSGQYQRGLLRFRDWYGDSIPEGRLLREMIKLNFLESHYHEIDSMLDNLPETDEGEWNYYHLASRMLQKDWSGANTIIDKNQDRSYPGFSELCSLALEQDKIKYSKPGVALTLSAFVPGLGKVYSHDWKDGIISFLFVATNAFQAYRGFSKDGVKSAYGWIFGTLGLGFYAGNLYGSWKSAKEYNYRLEDNLYHEIENTVYTRF